jgi:type II secretory pathway predicted ATPase ExeA
MSLPEPLIAAKLFRDVDAGRPHISASLDRLLQALLGHLREQRGIVVLTGARGSGKTIALGQLARDAEPGIAAAIVGATPLTTPDDLYHAVDRSLKTTPLAPDEPVQARIERSLPGAVPYPALLVDDAEALSPAALTAAVELAAPANGSRAITVLLASRLGRADLLRGAALTSVLSRTAEMPRLAPAQMELFIRARLRAARLPLDMFPPPVLETLGVQSEGLPAELIRLAADALERAIAAGRMIVSPPDLGAATAPASAQPPAGAAAAPKEAETETPPRKTGTPPGGAAAAPPPADLPTIVIAPRPKQAPPKALPHPARATAAPRPFVLPRRAKARRPVSLAREIFKVTALATATLGVGATLLVLAPELIERASEWTLRQRGGITVTAVPPQGDAGGVEALIAATQPATPAPVPAAPGIAAQQPAAGEPEAAAPPAAPVLASTPSPQPSAAPERAEPVAISPAPPAEAPVVPPRAPEPPTREVASLSLATPAPLTDAPAETAATPAPEIAPPAPIEEPLAGTAYAPVLPAESEESVAAAAAIDAMVASGGDDPLAAEELMQLFREAQAAIAAAADSAPAAPREPAAVATIDPGLRLAFEQFLKSLESSPAPAPVSETALRESFEQFLARVGAFGATSTGQATPVRAH